MNILSLNPYCSGRRSRTWLSQLPCAKIVEVLILIVVEEGLVRA